MTEIPTYPDDLVKETLRVNVVWPQTLIGTTVLVADKAFQGVLNGTYTWRQVAGGEITDAHRAAVAAAFMKGHAAYAIPRPLSSDLGVRRNYLQDVIGAGRRKYVDWAEWLTVDLYNGETPKEAFAGGELCEPESPEFIAIVGVWAHVAAKMRGTEGLALGARLREDLSTIWNEGPTDVREEALARLGTVNERLCQLVMAGATESQAGVEARLDRAAPFGFVANVTSAMVASIRVPAALPKVGKR